MPDVYDYRSSTERALQRRTERANRTAPPEVRAAQAEARIVRMEQGLQDIQLFLQQLRGEGGIDVAGAVITLNRKFLNAGGQPQANILLNLVYLDTDAELFYKTNVYTDGTKVAI